MKNTLVISGILARRWWDGVQQHRYYIELVGGKRFISFNADLWYSTKGMEDKKVFIQYYETKRLPVFINITAAHEQPH